MSETVAPLELTMVAGPAPDLTGQTAVIFYRPPDGKWLLSEYSDMSDVVELPSIGCRLALADVYEQGAVIKEEGPAWTIPASQETP